MVEKVEAPWPNLTDPLVVATAMSLYAFNVSPGIRAEKLYHHFRGACAEAHELVAVMQTPRVAFAATELAPPTAEVYVRHAMEKYGEEAENRVRINREFSMDRLGIQDEVPDNVIVHVIKRGEDGSLTKDGGGE